MAPLRTVLLVALSRFRRVRRILRATPPQNILPKAPPSACRSTRTVRRSPIALFFPSDGCSLASMSTISAGQVAQTARRPPADVPRRLGVVTVIHMSILTCTCASRTHGRSTHSIARRVEPRVERRCHAKSPRRKKKKADARASQSQRGTGLSQSLIRKLACRCAATRLCRSTAATP